MNKDKALFFTKVAFLICLVSLVSLMGAVASANAQSQEGGTIIGYERMKQAMQAGETIQLAQMRAGAPPASRTTADTPPAEAVYAGKKLSLDFKDTEVGKVLRAIADAGNVNMVVGSDVAGKTTSIRLVDVPWDQALDLVLKANCLGMVRAGNVIRIGSLDALHKETVSTGIIPVNYADVRDLASKVKVLLSGMGDVKVDERTKSLIVQDATAHIEAVRKLVKALDVRTPQVLIEARILEADLLFQRELGVKWGLQINRTRGDTTFQTGGGLSRTTLGQGTRDVVDLPAVPQGAAMGNPTAGVIEFMLSRGSLRSLDVAISAHENKGNVKLISSPKIATLDTKEASVEQGLRIPVRILNKFGVTSTEFVEANLKLTVTPHVTNDGNIRLCIKARRDEPDFSVTSVDQVPSINKKEAMTEVLIRDDGVVAIAGLYTIDQTDNNEGVPLFSKIPGLGWLFKRQAKEDRRRDLMIFISPKVFKEDLPTKEKS